MLLDAPPADASLRAVDVRAFLGAQGVADAVGQGDVVEYWKSAPYLFNFMDSYALKQAFKGTPEKDRMVSLVRKFPETFLDLERALPGFEECKVFWIEEPFAPDAIADLFAGRFFELEFEGGKFFAT